MFADYIEERCAKKNMSIARLEREAGLGNGTVRKWKSNSYMPNVETLKKISPILGVSVSTLVKEALNGINQGAAEKV